jgi:hypothetical protein
VQEVVLAIATDFAIYGRVPCQFLLEESIMSHHHQLKRSNTEISLKDSTFALHHSKSEPQLGRDADDTNQEPSPSRDQHSRGSAYSQINFFQQRSSHREAGYSHLRRNIGLPDLSMAYKRG